MILWQFQCVRFILDTHGLKSEQLMKEEGDEVGLCSQLESGADKIVRGLWLIYFSVIFTVNYFDLINV